MAIRKILVVDDVSTDLLNLQSILSNEGYQVVTAASGREAVEKAASDRPDMVFLDIIMDDMDGSEDPSVSSVAPGTYGIGVRADGIWSVIIEGPDNPAP